MKDTAIKYIFYNAICDKVASSELYHKLIKEVAEMQDEIKDLLPEDKKKLVNDLSANSSAMEADTAESYFIAGFELGLKLGAETFIKQDPS